jgi:hypothetical protein
MVAMEKWYVITLRDRNGRNDLTTQSPDKNTALEYIATVIDMMPDSCKIEISRRDVDKNLEV